jgi:hypothetical protein
VARSDTPRTVGKRLKGVFDATVAGAIVTVLGFFDDVTIGPIVIGLSAVLPALATFVGTAVVYSFVQYGASEWLIHHWDAWIHGENGRRFEARLGKWRQSRLTRGAVEGVTKGSLLAYTFASIVLAAVDVVAIWNLSSKEPLPQRNVVLSAVVYGTWCAALWTATGYGISVGIKSL